MSASIKDLKDENSQVHVLIAAASAGLLSRFCIAPLDVLKIRFQLQAHSLIEPSHTIVYRSSWQSIRSIIRNETIFALWKGNLSAEFLYLSYSSVQFLSYANIPRLLPTELNKDVKNFVSGSCAGGLATSLTYPFDLLRTRFAASAAVKVYPSLSNAIATIYASEGLKGFYRGLFSANLQVIPHMGLFFFSYENLRVLLPTVLPASFDKTEKSGGYLPASTAALSGTLSSIIAKTGVFPLDLIRKRLQVQGPTRGQYMHRNVPLHAGGVFVTAQEIVLREGFRGLYKGLPIALIKAAPASAITMSVYEGVLRFLKSEAKDTL